MWQYSTWQALVLNSLSFKERKAFLKKKTLPLTSKWILEPDLFYR